MSENLTQEEAEGVDKVFDFLDDLLFVGRNISKGNVEVLQDSRISKTTSYLRQTLVGPKNYDKVVKTAYNIRKRMNQAARFLAEEESPLEKQANEAETAEPSEKQEEDFVVYV